MTTPFITTQKPFTLVECGDEETGIITLIKKGFISVAEQMDLDQISVSSYQYQLMVGELIYRIVNDKKVSEEEARKVIQNPDKNILVAGDYMVDIRNIWDKYYEFRNNDLVQVTTAIKHRSLSEMEIGQFLKLPPNAPNATRKFVIGREPKDWNNNKTKELSKALFQAILEFFLGEQQEPEGDQLSRLVREIKPSDKVLSTAHQIGENASGDCKKHKTKDLTT